MSSTQRQLLMQRLAKARGLDIPNQAPKDAGQRSTQTIPPVSNTLSVPLSHAQERMWFLHQLDPEASAYNVCVIWHLRGQLNHQALKDSATRVSMRHGIFRTMYYTNDEGNARQKCTSSLPPEWRFEDLRKINAEDRVMQLESIAQYASTEPFDLSEKSSLRLILVALSDEQHALVMIGQHISWDGPSFGIFSRELANGYNLYQNGNRFDQAPPPTQYIDFAAWHRRQWESRSPEFDTTLKFWKAQLMPLPDPLDFPIDFERDAVNEESGSWTTETLDQDTTNTLLKLCAQEKVTPFEFLTTTIAVLMTRLARSPEVTIGTIASHRNLPELDDVIGNFGNVVPLRIKVPTSWSFRQLLQHCAGVCRSAFSHSDVPFEYLLDHLNIARGESSNPLLDTMVTFLTHGMDAPVMNGLAVEWNKHFNGTTQTDLSFDALLQNGCLQLQATWRTSLYRSNTIPKHLKRLRKLIQIFATTPDTVIAKNNLLLPNEFKQLTDHWGYRTALPSRASTLVDWFEKVVHEHPSAIAICQTQLDESLQGETETEVENGLEFTDLNSRANRLAHWLITQKIGPEKNVAICLPRRKEWFVAMLAILKTGAAFVPIDPNYPNDYIKRVIHLAEPSLIFVDAVTSSEIPTFEPNTEIGQNLIDLNSIEKAVLVEKRSNKNVLDAERIEPLQPTHPAYIVFTSGSSGEPKGVVVPHSALVNLLSSHRKDLYQEASKLTGRKKLRVGHAWSLAFDASWQPTLWMFEGHELHLIDDDTLHDPIALSRIIIERRLDFIELTPSMLNEVLPWLENGITDADGQHLPGHLPAILGFGGESVKEDLWQRLLNLEHTVGFNLYGPTETTVDTMIARANPGLSPSIGKPVAGAQAYVLDTCLQLTPPGIPGELAISGMGLARGYLSRGDITATRFIANPYGQKGSRLYLTGDRVSWLADGNMKYIGRIDEQIKIRGFRVEPLEVEASVEKLIKQPCAVIAHNLHSTPQLLCFIESAEYTTSSTPDSELIRRLCSESLPSHLVPKYFIGIQRLPRLPNGKIDRRSLPIPKLTDNKAGRSPGTELERKLCTLFTEVLGLDQVGIDDGFFELGGDSISVIKLVSLARRDGLILTARQVFDARSVIGLAARLENQNNASVTATKRPLKHDKNDTGLAPVTAIMQRYLDAGVPLDGFAQLVHLPLPQNVNEADLTELLRAIIQRHSLLRARLEKDQAGKIALYIPSVPIVNAAETHSTRALQTTPTVSSYTLCTDRKQSETQDTITPSALARKLCHQLNPKDGVMIAAAHVRDTSTDQNTLWLAVNHLVIDASSWHILAGDLAIAHGCQQRKEAASLPPVPTAWRSWSQTLPQPLSQPQTSPQPGPISYNQKNTGDRSALRGTLASAIKRSWFLPQQQGNCPVEAAAQKMGVTFTSLLPVLLAVATARAGLVSEKQREHLCLLIERNGREPNAFDQDLSRTVGWFANEVAIRFSKFEDLKVPFKTTEKLSQWCWEVAQTDTEKNHTGIPHNSNEWLLGFNYLGDLVTRGKPETWIPQPALDLLESACGEHWPLLHDLNINAYYENNEGTRLLRIDALGPKCHIDQSGLDNLFFSFQEIVTEISNIAPPGSELTSTNKVQHQGMKIKAVTPLQHEMLRQCQGEHDPWTTQMELVLSPTDKQNFTAESMKRSVRCLLDRHEALRTGFLNDTERTFIPDNLSPDWIYEDLIEFDAITQQTRLTEIRERWDLHRFNLDSPPLIRFMLIRLNTTQWLLLVKSHHLLLDGWSVPRLLHELLENAVGSYQEQAISLHWSGYLDWLQKQDQGQSWLFWNRELQGLNAPSLVCPERNQRSPGRELRDSINLSDNESLIQSVKNIDISPATVYQLAWARTLSNQLNQSDVVFGLFDSGRAAQIDGIESLVGLALQLLPVRIKTDSDTTTPEQLKQLQTRNFEWLALPPIQLDRLNASHRYGDFFDTLLVIENALEADTEIASLPQNTATKPSSLTIIKEQTWKDSIGQSMGLFVYPGNELALRLCYDPLSISSSFAHQVLLAFKKNVKRIADEIKTQAQSKIASGIKEPSI